VTNRYGPRGYLVDELVEVGQAGAERVVHDPVVDPCVLVHEDVAKPLHPAQSSRHVFGDHTRRGELAEQVVLFPRKTQAQAGDEEAAGIDRGLDRDLKQTLAPAPGLASPVALEVRRQDRPELGEVGAKLIELGQDPLLVNHRGRPPGTAGVGA
jgi:hypothetical protein